MKKGDFGFEYLEECEVQMVFLYYGDGQSGM